MAVAAFPSLVGLEPLHVQVETESELTRGLSLADRRPGAPADRRAPNCQVALTVDAPRALALTLEGSMPRVCVIGSANVDHAVTVPRLPRPGETVTGGDLLRDLGGKGANQAVAARRLGAEVRMLGGVGADPAGEEIRARLAALGIGVDGLVTVPSPTGAALIVVDAAGANQIAVAPGANHALTVEALAAHAEAIAVGRRRGLPARDPAAGGALGPERGEAPGCRDPPESCARPGARRRAASPDVATSRPMRERRAGFRTSR